MIAIAFDGYPSSHTRYLDPYHLGTTDIVYDVTRSWLDQLYGAAVSVGTEGDVRQRIFATYRLPKEHVNRLHLASLMVRYSGSDDVALRRVLLMKHRLRSLYVATKGNVGLFDAEAYRLMQDEENI